MRPPGTISSSLSVAREVGDVLDSCVFPGREKLPGRSEVRAIERRLNILPRPPLYLDGRAVLASGVSYCSLLARSVLSRQLTTSGSSTGVRIVRVEASVGKMRVSPRSE